MTRSTPRTARRQHRCEGSSSRCVGVIQPGQRYLEHVASPNDPDLGNTHWWRLQECSGCAAAYARPIESDTAPAGA